MRTTPQPAVSGVPVSLGGLTIGRSSSPAARPGGPSAAYQASGLGQRVLPSADHAGQVRYHLPIHAAANSAGPFAGIRDPATAYLRGNVSIYFLMALRVELIMSRVEKKNLLIQTFKKRRYMSLS